MPLENKRGRIRSEIFLRMLFHPFALMLYAVSWFHLYSLCQYGRVAKNIPILFACMVIWIFYIILYFVLKFQYRRNSPAHIWQQSIVENNIITVMTGLEQFVFSLKELNYYYFKGNTLTIFLYGKRIIRIICSNEQKRFLQLKLAAKKRSMSGVRKLTALFLLFITVIGSALVIHSAIPYEGKLSWYLSDLKNKKSVSFIHNNLYEDGLSGLLTDIETKITLPVTLSIDTGVNLHFAPDGQILTLDTMLYGFDKQGQFVDSYLISYNIKHSENISIWQHGSQGIYESGKDFKKLVDAISVIPVKQTIEDWDQEEYGILYYGVREWTEADENIIFISDKKEIIEAEDVPGAERSGYSISVFCPTDQSVEPIRYLWKNADELQYVRTQAKAASEELTQSAGDNKSDTVLPKEIIYHSPYLDIIEEQIGEVTKKSYDINNIEGDKIYSYSIDYFYLPDSHPFSTKINNQLKRVYKGWKKELQLAGQDYYNNKVEDYIRNGVLYYPATDITFMGVTCDNAEYFSALFLKRSGMGGGREYPVLVNVTISVITGEVIGIEQACRLSKEACKKAITESFREAYGYDTIKFTMGEEWYESYESNKEGGWGAGFYVTETNVYIYFGSGQIAPYHKGFPAVAIK